MKEAKIIFMGTPEFAVPTLNMLIEKHEHVAAVVTRPDRPVGRGRQIKAPPVKECALANGIPVLQPERVKDPAFLETFRQLRPDLAVVAAYGQLFSQALLDIPAFGFINVHSSLLPFYRGPAPINWAIINGDAETGVTIMRVSLGMDMGDILLQEKTAISPDDTAQTLHDRLAELGARLTVRTIYQLRDGSWNPVPQDHTRATIAPLLKKEDGRIDWRRDAAALFNQIRGMTPWPGCFTFFEGRLLKVHRAEPSPGVSTESPGTIVAAGSCGIAVATGKQQVLILRDVQLEGKKRLAAEEFLKGHALTPGMRFA